MWGPAIPAGWSPRRCAQRITRLTHDPDDRRQLAYLAASESGEAILIHRALHEADVVLPVGCLRAEEIAGYFGIHSPIFPTFSDAKTIQRFRSFGSLNGRGSRRRELVAEVDHVAWLLGVNFTVQVVPAAGDRVLHVLSGQSDAVRKRGRELYRAAWSWPATRRASLVVAAIEGDAGQQTWENVGLGAAGGRRLCRSGGCDCRMLRPGRRAGAGAAAHGASPSGASRPCGMSNGNRPSTQCPPPS